MEFCFKCKKIPTTMIVCTLHETVIGALHWTALHLATGLSEPTRAMGSCPPPYTVVCILVRMKYFPRFWRYHPLFRNKWYLIWTWASFAQPHILVKPHKCPSNQSIFLTQGSRKFSWKTLRVGNFDQKKLLHLNENMQPIHIKYHLFLHYVWFRLEESWKRLHPN